MISVAEASTPQGLVYQNFGFWFFGFGFVFPLKIETNCSYSFILSSRPEKMPEWLLCVKNKPRATPGGCPPSPHCSGTGWGSLRMHAVLERLAAMRQ